MSTMDQRRSSMNYFHSQLGEALARDVLVRAIVTDGIHAERTTIDVLSTVIRGMYERHTEVMRNYLDLMQKQPPPLIIKT